MAQKEGTIQRMDRQMNRVGKDVKSYAGAETEPSDETSSELSMVGYYSSSRNLENIIIHIHVRVP